MILETMEPRPVQARQSSIKCAYACKRKWLLKYRFRVTLRGEQVKESANLGKIYHKLKQLGPGHDSEVRAWVRQKQASLMDRVDKGEDLDGSMVRLANLMTDLYHKAEAMAHVFWERWPQPSYLEVIEKEIDFSYLWRDIEIGGRIDTLLRNEQDGSFWIRDDKSTGKTLDTIFGGLGWSIQARLYRLLAVEWITKEFAYTGPEEGKSQLVRGFIMDGTVKPGIKLCKKDEKKASELNITPQEAYLRRVKDWYKEQEELGKSMMLSKALIFNEPVFNSELNIALMMMKDLADSPIELDCFPRDITRQACMQYETQCEYHDLCEMSPNNWDSLFETKYRIKEDKIKLEDK